MVQKQQEQEQEESQSVRLKCQNCEHEWTYTGNNPRFGVCSRCKSSVSINLHRI